MKRRVVSILLGLALVATCTSGGFASRSEGESVHSDDCRCCDCVPCRELVA